MLPNRVQLIILTNCGPQPPPAALENVGGTHSDDRFHRGVVTSLPQKLTLAGEGACGPHHFLTTAFLIRLPTRTGFPSTHSSGNSAGRDVTKMCVDLWISPPTRTAPSLI